MYLVKTSWWLKAMYPFFVWSKPTKDKVLYLTFDDGPHPTITPFVLAQLKQFNAKATFFCIGKNVVDQPAIYRQILQEGHSVGNHTHNHLNGWKTNNHVYIENIQQAAKHIDSTLFRPPYGRIKKSQAKQLLTLNSQLQTIVMWDVLSADFDIHISPEKCLANVINNAKQGSIIVFHDSEKAWDRLSYALPKTLEYFAKMGYVFEAL
jgi:peptidoglycan/xylan/chitin deacetylase (PgdA/CDA1 family)